MRKQSSELLQDQLQDRQPGLHGSAETAPVRQVRGAAAARERRRDAPRALGMRSLLCRENAPCGPSWRVWRALCGQGQQMNAGAIGIGRGGWRGFGAWCKGCCACCAGACDRLRLLLLRLPGAVYSGHTCGRTCAAANAPPWGGGLCICLCCACTARALRSHSRRTAVAISFAG